MGIMSRLPILFLILVVHSTQMTNALNNPRKLDEGNIENKCGGCPCNNPCIPPSSPPPPPPVLPPPPPVLPPPSPPPPKKPPSGYCPPPPSEGGDGGGGYSPNQPNSQYIYMNGPPGDLYPVDQYFNGAKRSFTSGFSLLIGGFFLGLLALR
ncbi:sulfated surface glycoprotein 185-like [Lycium barbarum]|uniref:sulfated surface glycoprotein 185-like n=1 Tax=Lycium barbarum TaxID=112863 RepID=UPI00293E0B0C|nr:sulfated surface glycoprotein 185-like [Lycium barbarum]